MEAEDRSLQVVRRSPIQTPHLFSNTPPPFRSNSSTWPTTPRQNASTTTTEVSSNQSSIPAPTTAPTTAAASRTSLPEPSPQPDAFRDALVLPKTKRNTVYVYPYSASDIGENHHERFRTVVEMFKQNVESDKKLKMHVSEIDYMLKKCGPSPKEAHPSILVCCTERVFRDLERLLTSRHLTKQYYLPDPRRLGRWRANIIDNGAGAHIPRFKIYFWRGTPNRTLLWASRLADGLQIRQPEGTGNLPWSDLTMCGSKITGYDGSSATIACLLEVDSNTYGLTVAHAFAHLVSSFPEKGEPPNGGHNRHVSGRSFSEFGFHDDCFAVNDIEYESTEEGDTLSDSTGVTVVAVPDSEKRFGVGQEEERSVVLHLKDDGDPSSPDLDWALAEVSNGQSRKPNFCLSTEDPANPRLLHEVAEQHPGAEREVLIIRSIHCPRRGTLLPGSSFIGGINRPSPCEAWNVAFAGEHGLEKGDSGSLVVDLITNQIYGYVVGLNPLGEAYIMPMMATIRQVKEAFGTENVSMPDPSSRFTEMVEGSPIASLSTRFSSLQQSSCDQEPPSPVTSLSFESHSTQPEWDSWQPAAAHITNAVAVSSFSLHRRGPLSTISYPEKPAVPQEGILVFEETLQIPTTGSPVGGIWTQSSFALDNFNIAKYRRRFDRTFRPVIDKDINGACHCEYDVSSRGISPKVSWACFKIKEVRGASDYVWRQPCIHVEWDCQTGRQLIFVFDIFHPTTPDTAKRFLDRSPDYEERMINPFVWHRIFSHEVLERYDTALWSLRDLVRKQEKAWPVFAPFNALYYMAEQDRSIQSEAAFTPLHDIARHLFHYQETIEVAEQTLQALVNEQERWRQECAEIFRNNDILRPWLKTQQGLCFEMRRAHTLKMRLHSLSERHMNEISLALNLESQSLHRSAKTDSSSIMAITAVTMFFLPGTFVATIFSTNFFGPASSTWSASSEFWLYWVTTIPLTVVTILIWTFWQYRGNVSLMGASGKNLRARRDADALDGDMERAVPMRWVRAKDLEIGA
ncbi:uncharacterized protein DSM5745_07765 [Aspergillus mulundensis]|uniref:Uncharacterized protein n=1 Tax=Aspergillus mulundensis TaxID=1810919 RepID=A0A3D8REW2_9EURO|nr:hypothetical protein DSM5745_07765 [Aspergillus mulundensis]RDW72593.1 hypothetical protein DSM5745_07765 [Aspergillus mulundensis]